MPDFCLSKCLCVNRRLLVVAEGPVHMRFNMLRLQPDGLSVVLDGLHPVTL